MIAFKDFVPQELQPGGFLALPQYEMIDAIVRAANDWICRQGVQVLNVETVVLPNLWRSGSKGTGEGMRRTRGEAPSDWYQFIRVWYTAE